MLSYMETNFNILKKISRTSLVSYYNHFARTVEGGGRFTGKFCRGLNPYRRAGELFEGNADVEILGVVKATKENCEAYSKAFGVNVTPHPILGLPALP